MSVVVVYTDNSLCGLCASPQSFFVFFFSFVCLFYCEIRLREHVNSHRFMNHIHMCTFVDEKQHQYKKTCHRYSVIPDIVRIVIVCRMDVDLILHLYGLSMRKSTVEVSFVFSCATSTLYMYFANVCVISAFSIWLFFFSSFDQLIVSHNMNRHTGTGFDFWYLHPSMCSWYSAYHFHHLIIDWVSSTVIINN